MGKARRALSVPSAWKIVLMVSAATFLHPTSSAAQDPATGTVPVAKKAPPRAAGPEDVMVTAQRRPQRNKDVPVSVSRLSGSQVATILSDGSDIKGLAARVPSLNIESSFGRTFPRFYIRGLGNPDFDINAAQPVAVYYDDVVEENPLLKAFPLFDIDDVEVLAGPQGTLFGRNTPAGVVKITSKAPTDEFEGFLDQSIATYDTTTTTAVVNMPVIPGKLDLRISINNQRRDNWVKNDFNGQPEPGYVWRKNLEGFEDLAARAQALYTIDPTANILAEAQVRHLEGTSTLFRANIFNPGSNGLVANFDPARVAIDGDNYQEVNNRGGHVTLHKDLGSNAIDVTSAYEHASIRSRGDIDGGAPPDVPFDVETASVTPAVDQFTQEARVAMNGLGRFFNQAGIYYFHEYIDNFDQDFDPTGSLTTQVEEHQSTSSIGIFDSASYRVTNRLKIQAGVRYTNDSRTFIATRQFGFDGPLNVYGHAQSDNASWDASATYAITPDVNAYFRAATGYLPPSFQGRIDSDNFLSEARSERTTSYELGVKGAAFDRRMFVTADIYQWGHAQPAAHRRRRRLQHHPPAQREGRGRARRGAPVRCSPDPAPDAERQRELQTSPRSRIPRSRPRAAATAARCSTSSIPRRATSTSTATRCPTRRAGS